MTPKVGRCRVTVCVVRLRTARGRCLRRRATAIPREVVGLEAVRDVEDHPLAGQPAEQRAGHNDRRDRDGHTECQRDAQICAQQVDRSQRARVRRHQPVHRGKPCQRGNSDGDQRQLRPLGHQVDDRHQQHQTDLEEHRQADDRRRPTPLPTAVPAVRRARRWCRRSRRHRRNPRAVWRTSHRARSGCPRPPRSCRIRRRTSRIRRRGCSILATMPTVTAPKISARNGCSLATVISTTMSAIPASAATTNCHPAATGSANSVSAARMVMPPSGHRFSCSVVRASVWAT